MAGLSRAQRRAMKVPGLARRQSPTSRAARRRRMRLCWAAAVEAGLLGAAPLEHIWHLLLLLLLLLLLHCLLLHVLQGGRARLRWLVCAMPASVTHGRPGGRVHSWGCASAALVVLALGAPRDRLRQRLQSVLQEGNKAVESELKRHHCRTAGEDDPAGADSGSHRILGADVWCSPPAGGGCCAGGHRSRW
jgi:hypothetical protein